MGKAEDEGKSFWSSVIAKLPESQRAQAEALFAAPEAKDALVVLGTGALAQPEINRRLDDIKKQSDDLEQKAAQLEEDWSKLNAWYEPRKALVDKYPTLGAVDAAIAAAKGEAPVITRKPEETPVEGLGREDILKILEERDRGYAGVLGLGVEIGSKHLHLFGEPADMRGVIDLATKKGLSLEAAYNEKYGEKLAAKAKEAEDLRINKLVEEKLSEERKKLGSQPFPLRNAEPSVLDVLAAVDGKPADHTVDSAVALYDHLQSQRG